jgi:hypothetical protein
MNKWREQTAEYATRPSCARPCPDSHRDRCRINNPIGTTYEGETREGRRIDRQARPTPALGEEVFFRSAHTLKNVNGENNVGDGHYKPQRS